MNLIAIIPAGATELTVNGLHQWDYGRKLEIHASDLPQIVEVHFACPGMTEAVVRSCSQVNGVVTAVIPDECLEQTAPVTAWIFEIEGTTGLTTKKLTLPVVPRTKPHPSASIPIEITDRYTELITAVQETVGKYNEGEVLVHHSREADHALDADRAIAAETAAEATHATSADNATHATSADNATHAKSADDATHAVNAENAANADKLCGHAVEVEGGGAIKIDGNNLVFRKLVGSGNLVYDVLNMGGAQLIYTSERSVYGRVFEVRVCDKVAYIRAQLAEEIGATSIHNATYVTLYFETSATNGNLVRSAFYVISPDSSGMALQIKIQGTPFVDAYYRAPYEVYEIL